MNLNPFIDTPFEDPDAWEAFELAHGLAHERIYEAMLQAGKMLEHYPLFDLDRQSDWKLIHYSEHQSLYRALNIQGLPDLATVNLDKKDEWEDWMLFHAQVHSVLNVKLGITS